MILADPKVGNETWMSKAFIKETEPEEVEPDDGPSLLGGAKNYITLAGLARLQVELKHLNSVERPRVVPTLLKLPRQPERRDTTESRNLMKPLVLF